MGGHGALISYLKNPGQYQSVSAFSPICNPTQGAWGQKAFAGYLGMCACVLAGRVCVCLLLLCRRMIRVCLAFCLLCEQKHTGNLDRSIDISSTVLHWRRIT